MSEPIVILFSSSIDQMDYKQSYFRLAEFAENRGIDVRFVFGIENFMGGNTFTSYYKWESGRLTVYKESFTAGIVYLRNRTEVDGLEKRINNRFLENVCRDKYLTYTTFPEFVKKTIVIGANTIDQLDSLESDKVVLKPRYGANGVNVQILNKDEITVKSLKDEEYVVQELIDSSQGINGLINQRHELRVFVFDGIIRAVYIRVPAPNSYIANISRGAKEKQIILDDVPNSAHALIRSTDSAFQQIIPRIYTVDIMYENGRPWVVELNDNPGMPDIAIQPFTDNYFNALLDFLVKS